MTDKAALTAHVEAALAAQNAAAAEAAKIMSAEMRERGWSAVDVECEGMSGISRAQLSATGEWVDVDDEVAEELWDVVGWIGKPKFKWVGGDFDYVLSLDRLDPSAAHS